MFCISKIFVPRARPKYTSSRGCALRIPPGLSEVLGLFPSVSMLFPTLPVSADRTAKLFPHASRFLAILAGQSKQRPCRTPYIRKVLEGTSKAPHCCRRQTLSHHFGRER